MILDGGVEGWKAAGYELSPQPEESESTTHES
jgi:3-mercaptopyruvate sulfurtransferase SseA